MRCINVLRLFKGQSYCFKSITVLIKIGWSNDYSGKKFELLNFDDFDVIDPKKLE